MSIEKMNNLPGSPTLETAKIAPELDAKARAELKALTGFEFSHALTGRADDQEIGLITPEGRLMTLDYYGNGRFSLHEEHYNIGFAGTPSLVNLFQNIDSKEEFQIYHYENHFVDFGTFYESLSMPLRNVMGGVALFSGERPVGLNEWDFLGLAYTAAGIVTLFDESLFSETSYHEIAHLLTYTFDAKSQFIQDWQKLFDTHRSSNDCLDNLGEHGFITDYATTNYDEDISELVGVIYADPHAVKSVMNPIFRAKIELLHQYEYIRDDQYEFLIS